MTSPTRVPVRPHPGPRLRIEVAEVRLVERQRPNRGPTSPRASTCRCTRPDDPPMSPASIDESAQGVVLSVVAVDSDSFSVLKRSTSSCPPMAARSSLLFTVVDEDQGAGGRTRGLVVDRLHDRLLRRSEQHQQEGDKAAYLSEAPTAIYGANYDTSSRRPSRRWWPCDEDLLAQPQHRSVKLNTCRTSRERDLYPEQSNLPREIDGLPIWTHRRPARPWRLSRDDLPTARWAGARADEERRSSP